MTPDRSFFSRLRNSAATFTRDEDGSATVWSVVMFLLFCGIAGIAVDMNNGYRVKTGMASTADVVALAGAWDLPEPYLELTYAEVDKNLVRASAEQYAWRNMKKQYHGNYIVPDHDVRIGRWYPSIRKFAEGATPVNAVHVGLSRNGERENSVPTMLLRIAGLWKYDVNVQSVAMVGIHECHVHGIIARETLKITPNAKMLGSTCLHGQLGVDVRPGVCWSGEEAAESAITTGTNPQSYTKDRWRVTDGTVCDSGETVDFPEEPMNPSTGDLYPLMVDGIPTIGYGMIAGWTHYEHFAYPRTNKALNFISQEGDFIDLPDGFNTVLGTSDPTADAGGAPVDFGWLENGVQLASLDGFSSLGALLGLSAKAASEPDWYTGTEVEGIPTERYEEDANNYNNYQWPEDPTVLSEAKLPVGSLSTSALYPGGTESSVLVPMQRYFIERCGNGGGSGQPGTLTLSGVIKDVTIVTNCKLVIDTNTHVYNSVLLTTDGVKGGSESGILIKNGAVIGEPTVCKNSGGVRLYSGGDIVVTGSGNKFDDDGDPDDVSTSQFWGVQMVARRDIHFAGKGDAEKGISMHAGGEIHFSAQAEIAGLSLDVTEEDTETMINCPEDGNGFVYSADAYIPVLVH